MAYFIRPKRPQWNDEWPEDKTKLKAQIAEGMKHFKGEIKKLPPSGITHSPVGCYGKLDKLF